MDDRLIAPREAMEVLRIGQNNVYALFLSPGFPLVRLGKKMFVRESALKKWIEQQERSHNTDVLARMRRLGITFGDLEQIFHVNRGTIRVMIENGSIHADDLSALNRFLDGEAKRQGVAE